MEALKTKKACPMVERNLVDLAENSLNRKTYQETQEHLEQCERCARLSRHFISAWQNLSSLEEIGLCPAALADLMKKVVAYDEHSSRWPEILLSARRFLQPALMTLLLLAGIMAGHELGKIPQHRAQLEDSLTARLLGGFRDIPLGSVADFYAGQQILEKEKKNEK